MPRTARQNSKSNIYHCILRGVNRQDIFLDNQDYLKFKRILKKSKEKFTYKIYSYVLMSNHVHLEIKEEKHQLSKLMQSIEIRYANYFNKKYERTGHLFENRFKSKEVETISYTLNLMRYIHQNPEIANISSMDKYKWSSYQEYFKKQSIINKEEIFKLFDGKNPIKKFIEFNKQYNEIEKSKDFLEYELEKYLTDTQAIEFIKRIMLTDNVQEIQKYNIQYRNRILRELKKISGCTHTQLSRILGISIRIIQRA